MAPFGSNSPLWTPADPNAERWDLDLHLYTLELCQWQLAEALLVLLSAQSPSGWSSPAARAFTVQVQAAVTKLRQADSRLDAASDRARGLLWSLP